LRNGLKTLDTRSADDAQRRVNQIRAFRAELAALRAAGASPLTPDQEAALAAFHDQLLARLTSQYDVDATERAGQLSRGMRLLSFFGAVTLTAAVYSLVAHYWGRFDLALQAALLVAFPLMALVGVELSARRERTLYVASLFAVVAYSTFWLAVGELWRTLNIPATPPFIWAGVLFGLALAIPYGFRLILAVALVALAIAMAASLFQAAGTEATQLFERLEILTAAGFSLLLLAVPLARIDLDFLPVVRLVAFAIGLSCLLALSVSGRMSLLPISAHAAETVYQAVMLIGCVAALVVSIRLHWTETLRLSAVMLALFLLSRYVDWFWDAVPAYVFFLVLAVLAFGWLLMLRRMRARLAVVRR
jgi:hypothetical protein